MSERNRANRILVIVVLLYISLETTLFVAGLCVDLVKHIGGR